MKERGMWGCFGVVEINLRKHDVVVVKMPTINYTGKILTKGVYGILRIHMWQQYIKHILEDFDIENQQQPWLTRVVASSE